MSVKAFTAYLTFFNSTKMIYEVVSYNRAGVLNRFEIHESTHGWISCQVGEDRLFQVDGYNGSTECLKIKFSL